VIKDLDDYNKFIENKNKFIVNKGFTCDADLIEKYNMFEHQSDMVKLALKKGKFAIFADTGLGKSIMGLSWCNEIHEKYNEPVLICTPLSVADQFIKEASKFNIEHCKIISNTVDIINGINIINYEKLHKIDTEKFIAVCLDESSILKSFTGKVRSNIIDSFKNTKFKLCESATPSPNDYMEFMNHCEFLDVMEGNSMLSMFFTHDGGDTSKWIIKPHAKESFFEFLTTWALFIKNPIDYGYDFDMSKELPSLIIKDVIIDSSSGKEIDANDIIGIVNNNTESYSMTDRRNNRKITLKYRCDKVKQIVNTNDEKYLIWCDLNDESDELNKIIDKAEDLQGKHNIDQKIDKMNRFSNNELDVLITKPKIAGFGMNWQHCRNVIFCGISDSYEQFYQSIRRCYRYGQKRDVNVYVVCTEKDLVVLENIKRKEKNHNDLYNNTIKYSMYELKGIHKEKKDNIYNATKQFNKPNFLIKGKK